MLILPAIDLLGGRCVRLIQGDYDRELPYDADPVEVAASFADAGVEWIHMVDLDGAKTGQPANLHIVESVAKQTAAKIEVGGGVRSLETAKRLLDAGAGRVVVGTKLVQDWELAQRFFEELGERVVAGIDARQGMVAVHGWREGSDLRAVDLATKVEAMGCHRIILTDIAKDGMMQGPNTELFLEVARSVKIPVIHSGGVATADDVRTLAKLDPAPEGAIVGRALYEGRVKLTELLSAA
jgi:phosphoribosylformimino-5-aminoimidazole carboxamide ribotide isomerase